MAIRFRALHSTIVPNALAVAAAVMVLVWCTYFRGGLAWKSSNKNLIFNVSFQSLFSLGIVQKTICLLFMCSYGFQQNFVWFLFLLPLCVIYSLQYPPIHIYQNSMFLWLFVTVDKWNYSIFFTVKVQLLPLPNYSYIKL